MGVLQEMVLQGPDHHIDSKDNDHEDQPRRKKGVVLGGMNYGFSKLCS
jgi:hypothetical protein